MCGKAFLFCSIAAMVIAACGGSGTARSRPAASTNPRPSLTATASPSPPRSVAIALHDSTAGVDFLSPDGTRLGQASVPVNTVSGLTGAAGRVWFIGDDDHLRTVDVRGAAADLGVLAGLGSTGTPNGLAVSPDGNRWAWGACVNCGPGGTARVYVGGIAVAPRVALEEPTSNEVLVPLAWTQQGIWVERQITGIGGCCYLTPESAGRDLLFVDPASLTQRYVWKGCTASFINTLGSFSCGTEVHLSGGSILDVQPLPPVQGIGWEMVDEADANLIFAVIHTRGTGDGGCPCAIDTERAPLGGGTTTALVDQMTPDGVLPDGSIVARTAPAMPGQGGAYNEWIVTPQGKATQLGPNDAVFLAVVPLT